MRVCGFLTCTQNATLHLGKRKKGSYYLSPFPFLPSDVIFQIEHVWLYDPFMKYTLQVDENATTGGSAKMIMVEKPPFSIDIAKLLVQKCVEADIPVHGLNQNSTWEQFAMRVEWKKYTHLSKTMLLWNPYFVHRGDHLGITSNTRPEKISAIVEMKEPQLAAFETGALKLSWNRLFSFDKTEIDHTNTCVISGFTFSKKLLMFTAFVFQTVILPFLKQGHTYIPNHVLQEWSENWVCLSGHFDTLIKLKVGIKCNQGFAMMDAIKRSNLLANAFWAIGYNMPETSSINNIFIKEGADEIQSNAIQQAAAQKITIISGKPGAGKTSYVLSSIIKTLVDNEIEFFMIAHTGAAAKRMAECLHTVGIDKDIVIKKLQPCIEPKTIAMHCIMLKTRAYSDRKRYPVGIIEEASKVSETDFLRVLSLSSIYVERLIIVGDSNQIKPIDSGCPMHDLLSSQIHTFYPSCSVAYLERQYRADDDSYILYENADKILRKDANFIEKPNVFEILWLPQNCIDPMEVFKEKWLAPRILCLDRKRIRDEEKYDILDLDKTLFITPTRKDASRINAAITHLQHPLTKREGYAEKSLYPGKNILCDKNYYISLFEKTDQVSSSLCDKLSKGGYSSTKAMDKNGDVYLKTPFLYYCNGHRTTVKGVYDVMNSMSNKLKGIPGYMRDGTPFPPDYHLALEAFKTRKMKEPSSLVKYNPEQMTRVVLTTDQLVITEVGNVSGGNASTVDRTQGWEYETVVFYIGNPFKYAVVDHSGKTLYHFTPDKLYTGCTRGKKRVVIVVQDDGNHGTLQRILDSENKPRYTLLKLIIEAQKNNEFDEMLLQITPDTIKNYIDESLKENKDEEYSSRRKDVEDIPEEPIVSEPVVAEEPFKFQFV